jgi:hypothetical protein
MEMCDKTYIKCLEWKPVSSKNYQWEQYMPLQNVAIVPLLG